MCACRDDDKRRLIEEEIERTREWEERNTEAAGRCCCQLFSSAKAENRGTRRLSRLARILLTELGALSTDLDCVYLISHDWSSRTVCVNLSMSLRWQNALTICSNSQRSEYRDRKKRTNRITFKRYRDICAIFMPHSLMQSQFHAAITFTMPDNSPASPSNTQNLNPNSPPKSNQTPLTNRFTKGQLPLPTPNPLFHISTGFSHDDRPRTLTPRRPLLKAR